MNDSQPFFDLAMKVIAHQAGDAERAELEALLASQPGLKSEFERLRAQVRIAQEALPLVNATEATAGELPAYARGRLRTKVRQTLTLGRQRPSTESVDERELKAMWRWRWVMGLAAATAVAALVLVPMLMKPAAPEIQVAMLDTTGATRGSDANEAAELRRTWENATVDSFSNAESLRAWEAKAKGAMVVFDRAAGEVRVSGRWKGKSFEKTFLVEQDLAATLKQADSFIKENTSR